MTTLLTEAALALRFHHVGIAVPALPEAVESYRTMFGYEVLSGPFDDPIQRVSVCFVGPGAGVPPVLELVAPADSDSPAGRMLERGIGAYHMCYETDDLDTTLARARASGWVPVGAPVPAVAFDGRRIAWLFTPTKQLVELVQA